MIKLFGDISGYKVNDLKSSILMLNHVERQNPTAETSSFKVVDKFEYLGVVISPKLNEIVKVNYDYLKENIKDLID